MSSMSRLTSRFTSARDGAATSIVSVPSGRLERDIRRLAKPAFCTARSNRFASLTFHWTFFFGMWHRSFDTRRVLFGPVFVFIWSFSHMCGILSRYCFDLFDPVFVCSRVLFVRARLRLFVRVPRRFEWDSLVVIPGESWGHDFHWIAPRTGSIRVVESLTIRPQWSGLRQWSDLNGWPKWLLAALMIRFVPCVQS